MVMTLSYYCRGFMTDLAGSAQAKPAVMKGLSNMIIARSAVRSSRIDHVPHKNEAEPSRHFVIKEQRENFAFSKRTRCSGVGERRKNAAARETLRREIIL